LVLQAFSYFITQNNRHKLMPNITLKKKSREINANKNQN